MRVMLVIGFLLLAASSHADTPKPVIPSPTFMMLRNNQLEARQAKVALESAIVLAQIELTRAQGLNEINIATKGFDSRAAAPLEVKRTAMIVLAAELTVKEVTARRDIAAWEEYLWGAQATLASGGAFSSSELARGYDQLQQIHESAANIALERATLQRDFYQEFHTAIEALDAQGAESGAHVVESARDLAKACAEIVGAQSLAALAIEIRSTLMRMEPELLAPDAPKPPPPPSAKSADK